MLLPKKSHETLQYKTTDRYKSLGELTKEKAQGNGVFQNPKGNFPCRKQLPCAKNGIVPGAVIGENDFVGQAGLIQYAFQLFFNIWRPVIGTKGNGNFHTLSSDILIHISFFFEIHRRGNGRNPKSPA